MASLAAATQRTRRRLASAASKPRRRRRRRRDLPPRHYDNTTPLSRPARRALAEGLDDLALQRLRKLAEGPPLLVGELGTSSHKELVKTIYQRQASLLAQIPKVTSSQQLAAIKEQQALLDTALARHTTAVSTLVDTVNQRTTTVGGTRVVRSRPASAPVVRAGSPNRSQVARAAHQSRRQRGGRQQSVGQSLQPDSDGTVPAGSGVAVARARTRRRPASALPATGVHVAAEKAAAATNAAARAAAAASKARHKQEEAQPSNGGGGAAAASTTTTTAARRGQAQRKRRPASATAASGARAAAGARPILPPRWQRPASAYARPQHSSGSSGDGGGGGTLVTYVDTGRGMVGAPAHAARLQHQRQRPHRRPVSASTRRGSQERRTLTPSERKRRGMLARERRNRSAHARMTAARPRRTADVEESDDAALGVYEDADDEGEHAMDAIEGTMAPNSSTSGGGGGGGGGGSSIAKRAWWISPLGTADTMEAFGYGEAHPGEGSMEAPPQPDSNAPATVTADAHTYAAIQIQRLFRGYSAREAIVVLLAARLQQRLEVNAAEQGSEGQPAAAASEDGDSRSASEPPFRDLYEGIDAGFKHTSPLQVPALPETDAHTATPPPQRRRASPTTPARSPSGEVSTPGSAYRKPIVEVAALHEQQIVQPTSPKVSAAAAAVQPPHAAAAESLTTSPVIQALGGNEPAKSDPTTTPEAANRTKRRRGRRRRRVRSARRARYPPEWSLDGRRVRRRPLSPVVSPQPAQHTAGGHHNATATPSPEPQRHRGRPMSAGASYSRRRSERSPLPRWSPSGRGTRASPGSAGMGPMSPVRTRAESHVSTPSPEGTEEPLLLPGVVDEADETSSPAARLDFSDERLHAVTVGAHKQGGTTGTVRADADAVALLAATPPRRSTTPNRATTAAVPAHAPDLTEPATPSPFAQHRLAAQASDAAADRAQAAAADKAALEAKVAQAAAATAQGPSSNGSDLANLLGSARTYQDFVSDGQRLWQGYGAAMPDVLMEGDAFVQHGVGHKPQSRSRARARAVAASGTMSWGVTPVPQGAAATTTAAATTNAASSSATPGSAFRHDSRAGRREQWGSGSSEGGDAVLQIGSPGYAAQFYQPAANWSPERQLDFAAAYAKRRRELAAKASRPRSHRGGGGGAASPAGFAAPPPEGMPVSTTAGRVTHLANALESLLANPSPGPSKHTITSQY